MSPLAFFQSIVQTLEQQNSHLTRSHMLSSPAIEYKGRVFAFYQQDQMVIRLSDQERLAGIGVKTAGHYRPFTSPVTLTQWKQVPFYYHADWHEIAKMALDAVKAEVDSPLTD